MAVAKRHLNKQVIDFGCTSKGATELPHANEAPRYPLTAIRGLKPRALTTPEAGEHQEHIQPWREGKVHTPLWKSVGLFL